MRSRRWQIALVLALVALTIAALVAWLRVQRRKPALVAPEPERKVHAPLGAPIDARRQAILQLNNRGVAAMEQFRFRDAADLFQQARTLDPAFVPAGVNLGLAFFYDRRTDEAATALERVGSRNPTARFVLALIERERGRNRRALEHLAVVLEHDARDAAALYLAGSLESAERRFERAIAHYRASLESDPRSASALYGLARALISSGDPARGEEVMARFQEVKRVGGSSSFGNLYLEQGRYAQALASPRSGVPPAAQRPTFAEVAASSGILFRHEGPAREASLEGSPGPESAAAFGSGAAFLDFDGDGWLDLYLANASGAGASRSVLYRNQHGTFVQVPDSGAAFDGIAMGVAASDYDNDGRPDLFVAGFRRSALFHNEGEGKFRDAASRLPKGVFDTRWCLSPAWADVDHDGDLDLAVAAVDAATGAGSNLLFRNNRNGTFREIASAARVRARSAATALLLTDFNRARDLDLLLVGSPWRLLSNARDGTFVEAQVRLPEAGALGAAAADFDGDGQIDLCAPSRDGALLLWNRGGTFDARAVPVASRTPFRNAHAFDFDNDGDADVLLVGDELRLLENVGGRRFTDVTAAVGLDRIDAGASRAVASADFDRDGDLDVLVTRCGRAPLLLRNDGGNRNRALRLSLEGKGDNRPGLGSSIELAAAGLYTRIEWTGQLGYMSQSATDVLLGLGPSGSPDFVRVLWPSGVLQTETLKPEDLRLRVVELDRKGTSCPILYAWDGSRYSFVTDFLGGSAVGYLVSPGRYAVPDTDEYVKIDGTRLKERDGKASLRLVNQLEETIFFDKIRLLAVDHPAGVEVFPDERLSGPPFPEFRVVASRAPRPVRSACDGRGRPWTAELGAVDRCYARGFDLLPFKGYAEPHDIVLELGDLTKSERVVLLLDGWVEYADSTSNFAASQAGLTLQPPRLEAWDGSGWRTILEDMGFPAGLPRTMVVDLTGKIACSRAARLRIRTNMCIYWDRIRVETGAADPDIRVLPVETAEAAVAWVGYPRPWSPDGLAPPAYDYDRRDATAPWKRHKGRYTAEGDVRELVEQVDDRYVVLPHGEALCVEFATRGLPPLDAGWTRDWFLYADGFGKDMDLHSAAADTVDPLPRHRDLPYRKPEWRLASDSVWETFRATLVERSRR